MSESTRLVLEAGVLLPALHDALDSEFSVVRLPETDIPSFLAEHGQDISIAVTTGKIGLSGDVIRALPGLRAIVGFGVGYDSNDVSAARKQGVSIANTPDVLTDCVADIAVGLVIDVFRGISAADRFVRRGDWANGNYPLTSKLTGKKVGILGLGRIGRAIARRLEGFDMRLAYHNRSPIQGVPYTYLESAEQLAAQSDVLIVATSASPDSAKLVSRDVLDALGPRGFLINVARGSVVDEEALVEALVEHKIGGAGLDVFASEPRVPKALFALNNVVLLPHMASGTHETRQAMTELVIANVRQFMVNGTLITPVTI